MSEEKPAYKVKRQITVPLCKLNPGEPVPVVFEGQPIRHVQIDAKPDKDGKVKNPAAVLRCMRVDTGEVVDLIASTVLLSQLEREYGNYEGALKGVALLLESTGKRAGKNYNDIRIAEIDIS
jgi:hypothetical protein